MDLEKLIEAMSMPVLLIGPDERVAMLNTSAHRLFGATGRGRHYITALRQPDLLDAIEQTIRDGQPRTSSYTSFETGSDTTWLAHVSAAKLSRERHILLTFEDVTSVEKAGKMRRDFVANVSHELKTPLTAILGFVETLRHAARDDPAAQSRFLEIIDGETRRMASLVDDLLSLSRVEEDERFRPTSRVDLRQIVQDALTSMKALADQHGVRLVFDAPETAMLLPGDARQLGQVVTNLISNAIKYGGADGTVTIGLSGPETSPALRSQALTLSVRDTGPGIPAHHIGRLTERFYRLDDHRSRDKGGTGLGLAIVKHIVNRHRGRLRIESVMEQGSIFTVILPVA